MKSWQLAVIIGVVTVAIGAGVFFFLGSSGSVAATVNGVAIPKSEIDKQLEVVKQSQAEIFKGPDGEEQEKRYRQQVLDFLISAELVRQEAKRLGITVTEKEIDEKVDQIKKLFDKPELFKKALKEQGLTEDVLREKIADQAVGDKMMERMSKDIKLSDKQLKDFFETNKDQFKNPAQKRWRQILVKSESKAKELLTKLNGGADFAELAKSESTDERTKKLGGDLGWSGPNDFPPDIAKGLENVKVGEVSDVIKSADGSYSVYKLDEVKAERVPSYKEVKDQVEQLAMRNEQQTKFTALLEKLKKKAKIVKKDI